MTSKASQASCEYGDAVPALGASFGIAFSHQRIEIRKDEAATRKPLFSSKVGFEGGALAQQADHQLRRLAARGSVNACCHAGKRSSEPTNAPMNVGTSSGGRSGYIRQNPTASTNARASSMVRMGLPSSRHFCRAAVAEVPGRS